MDSKKRFAKLLEPAYIGSVRLRNRIVKTAAGTSLIEKDGTVGERMRCFYETFAKGGVGLLIFETCSVEHPRGSHRPSASAHLDDDRLIPSYKAMTDAVHRHGCPMFIQLMHAGAWFPAGQDDDPGDRISSSALKKEELPSPDFYPPRELSVIEIKEMVDTFARAAERAQKAGFDGVELNGSHYHLINSFLSRFWNRRTDAYGSGSLESRSRFICEIIREVKRRCGPDFAVDTLINGAEYGLKNGLTIEEVKGIARLMQEAGADSIQLRAAGFGLFSGILHIDRLFYPELPQEAMVKGLDWGRHGKGIVVPYATEVKKAVSIPVYVASRLDPELGEALLRQGKLDLVGMTRRLLADPELPHKVAEGRLDDIVPCAGCNYCWHTRIQNKPVKCRMNAALGREIEMTITPAEEKKRVLVVGGGPAGMEAARVAALRGHEVTLCDREVRLGGSMSVAALVKDYEREKILDQIGYLKAQLKKLGVKLKLGKEISSPLVEATKADVVILATGGLPHVPDIPGIQSPKVVNNYKLHRMLKHYMRFFGPNLLAWLTKFWMPVGKNVVIIGGALHGCQLGEFLAKHGRRVTIVDESAKLGDGLLSDDPVRLFRWFQKKGVVLMPAVKYRRITDEGLVLTNNKGRELTLQADTIITALPLKPDTEIAKKLAGGNRVKVYQIGDCRSPAYMPDAIADGFEAALKI